MSYTLELDEYIIMDGNDSRCFTDVHDALNYWTLLMSIAYAATIMQLKNTQVLQQVPFE